MFAIRYEKITKRTQKMGSFLRLPPIINQHPAACDLHPYKGGD